MPHALYMVFLFAFGACVGSFLNVVVWRLPRNKSLISPPSHCPRCDTPLAWYDNVPVFGWLMLRGRCRYCAEPVSFRYPFVEFLTGALFVFYYWAFFMAHWGPCIPRLAPGLDGLPPAIVYDHLQLIGDHWLVYGLLMLLVSSLLAASLVDAELFVIPVQIPWLLAVVGLVVHSVVDKPRLPGNVMVDPRGIGGALALGSGLGLILSIALFLLKKIPQSFPDGEPELEVDKEKRAEQDQPAEPGWLERVIGRLIDAYRGEPTPRQLQMMDAARKRREKEGRPEKPDDLPPPGPVMTRAQINAEIRKEMLFLLFPLAGGLLALLLVFLVPAARLAYEGMLAYEPVRGLLGALLGALVGAFIVWFFRIAGTLGFGRVAMGLGDVHLMLGVGAIVGAGPVTVAFFLAPFAGLAVGIYSWLTRNRRELPYGPYLSLATAAVLLVYCPIAGYLRPGLQGMADMLRTMTGP